MKKSLVRKIITPIPMILMLVIIWSFSAQNGTESGSLSRAIAVGIYNFINRLFSRTPSEQELATVPGIMEFFIRKAAHITEYLLLTLTVWLPVDEYTKNERFVLATESSAYALGRLGTTYHSSAKSRFSFSEKIIVTLLATVLFASLDELHQRFVGGRAGQVTDVLIDSIGIVIACALLTLLQLKPRKKLHTPQPLGVEIKKKP